MLDAHPAPPAPARPQAVPVSPIAEPAGPQPASAPAALLAAARTLLPVLEAGRALDARTLREAMTSTFGASDADGAWLWKDSYEAAEAALVLFLQRYGRAMRREAGAGPGGPGAMLRMLETLAALDPSQTRRSEEQLKYQQFSTPLPLAYAALQAAMIRPGDVVLEPSAGTGMLAVMAQLALGNDTDALHLNEIAAVRAGLLAGLFPGSAVTRHNAESIRDRLPELRPTVVLMNPPFSASPGVERIRHHVDLHHIRSAVSMLPPGGRLVAISSAHCVPGDAAWEDAFASLDPPAHAVFTAPIDGRAYARRGTTFDTRLTVLDRGGEKPARVYAGHPVRDAGHLLQALTGTVPARRPIEPVPGADLFGQAPAPSRRSRPTRARHTGTAAHPPEPHDWGPVAELAFEAVPAGGGPAKGAQPSGPYARWRASSIHLPGAVEHPTPLVQSGAMAAVPHPMPSYRPMLPEKVVAEGLLSDAQLESVILAGQAHERHLAAEYRIGAGWETVRRVDTDGDDANDEAAHASEDDGKTVDADEPLSDPVRFRRGWMLGDGTGCGKGRQVAAIVLDQWLRGRRRALWLSQSDKLLEDARRDWCAVGGRADDVFPLGKVRQGADIPHAEGILFATYATLRSPARQGKPSRLDQIVAWLADGEGEEERHAYSGVIVFDEAHAMANAAGSKGSRGEVRPSQQGRAGLRLQNALPDARILYVSATGATTVPGLAYARRLGLWASGETPFETRVAFVAAMEAGGVAAMEVVARDLKALGLYQARALSYDGVEVDILEHPLTPEQRRIYDSYAGAFKIIHQNIQEALKATGIEDGESTLNKNAKSAALSAFEGAKQRFFGHLLTSMKCPSLIRSIEADLDGGRSAVVQLVSTGEALMERRIAEIPASEWDDLSIDLTPREYVLDFLQHAFPVQLQEPFEDDDGNLMSRPVFDADNNPVLCQEALAKRDALIQKLGALPPVQSALDQIVHRFGHDTVAEITGRSRRVLRIDDARGERLAVRSRPASANLAETAAFMDGEKKILVFSMAGGIGRSYHADLGCPNTERRTFGANYLTQGRFFSLTVQPGDGCCNRPFPRCNRNRENAMPRINLTDARIGALNPRKTARDIRDGKLKGFGIRVLPSGRKRFFVHCQHDGERVWKIVGDTDGMSVAEARSRAANMLAAIRRGGPAPTRPEETLFETVAQTVFDHHRRLWKAGTLTVNRNYLRNQILPHFAKRPIADIDAHEVRNWFASLHATPVAADRSMPVLSVIMREAEAMGLRPEGSNPCRGIRRYRRKGRARFLSDDEIRRLSERLSACADQYPRQVAAIRLLLLTGCRKNEILTLRWSDYREGRLFLRDSKSGPRTVWLSQPARTILDALDRKGSWVFPACRAAGPQTKGSLDRFWYTLRAEAGLPDVRLHDLRHSYASIALKNGETVLAIARLLGHRSPQTTLAYTHFADAMAMDAAETIGIVLGGRP